MIARVQHPLPSYSGWTTHMPVSGSGSLPGMSQWTRAHKYALSPSLKENKCYERTFFIFRLSITIKGLSKKQHGTRSQDQE